MALLAAAALALGSVGVVSADGTVALIASQQNLSWDQAPVGDCSGTGFEPGDNQVVWRFVLTGATAITDASLTATFGNQVESARAMDFKSGSTISWFVTTGTDTLLDAFADYVGTAGSTRLVVSSVCIGNMGGGGGGGAGAGDTPVGSNVVVGPDGTPNPGDILVTFETVTVEGTTSVTISDTGPELPAGFQAGDPATYWDLVTTAGYAGSITACFSYAGQTPAPTSLLHYEGGAWADVTSSNDTSAQVICGVSTSLSPWVAVHIAPPTVTVPSDISVIASGRNGAAVTYTASAVDHTGTSLSATCVPASGSTFPIGTTSVTCSATDDHGTGSASFNVVVGYAFAGFAQPVNDPITASNPMSVFKVGSTIIARFSLKYSTGALVSDDDAAAIAARCGAAVFLSEGAAGAAAIDEAASYATPNVGPCARYDAKADQFVLNIGTKGANAPATDILIGVVDGPDFTRVTYHQVLVGLR